MVAPGAGLDPARTGNVRRQDAADRAASGDAAENAGVVHRLEGELLAVGGEERFDFGERRAGLGREHKLLGLVEGDAGQRGKIERQVRLRRPADRALGAVPHDFHRLALGQRPLHRRLDILGIAGLDGVGHRRLRTSEYPETRLARRARACARARRSGAASEIPCPD